MLSMTGGGGHCRSDSEPQQHCYPCRTARWRQAPSHPIALPQNLWPSITVVVPSFGIRIVPQSPEALPYDLLAPTPADCLGELGWTARGQYVLESQSGNHDCWRPPNNRAVEVQATSRPHVEDRSRTPAFRGFIDIDLGRSPPQRLFLNRTAPERRASLDREVVKSRSRHIGFWHQGRHPTPGCACFSAGSQESDYAS